MPQPGPPDDTVARAAGDVYKPAALEAVPEALLEQRRSFARLSAELQALREELNRKLEASLLAAQAKASCLCVEPAPAPSPSGTCAKTASDGPNAVQLAPPTQVLECVAQEGGELMLPEHMHSSSNHDTKKKKKPNLKLTAEEAPALGERLDKVQVPEWRLRVRKLLGSMRFDIGMTAVIFINFLIGCIRHELEGASAGVQLGLHPGPVPYSAGVEAAFEAMEICFVFIYAMELALNVVAFGPRYFRTLLHCLDAFIVVVGCTEQLIVKPFTQSGTQANFTFVRIFKILRIFRFARALQIVHYIQDLRVLVKTLVASIRSLMWSLLLISSFIVVGAITMINLTKEYILTEGLPSETRVFFFEKFSTPSRASYTMFEATFSAAWVPTAYRCLQVNGFFALFWVLYVIGVNFAVIRVVGALFLKQTMEVANLDKERMLMEKMKHKDATAATLREIFKLADTSGDGSISRTEFESMLEEHEIVDLLKKLDLDLDEVEALFSVLSADDGEADYEEFLAGALKMKSSARTIDAVQIVHQQMKVQRDIQLIVNLFAKSARRWWTSWPRRRAPCSCASL
eukprot:TRINITY_DN774_c0_g2_i2.p1 TRINITY_DN774_c0_g2~~TRINITY_DN774_c0_g2_i2.p1  ORF type:complete len:572 (+),score=163.45 TRINITY_DN774_c0_g2_i2:55-1770(+)